MFLAVFSWLLIPYGPLLCSRGPLQYLVIPHSNSTSHLERWTVAAGRGLGGMAKPKCTLNGRQQRGSRKGGAVIFLFLWKCLFVVIHSSVTKVMLELASFRTIALTSGAWDAMRAKLAWKLNFPWLSFAQTLQKKVQIRLIAILYIMRQWHMQTVLMEPRLTSIALDAFLLHHTFLYTHPTRIGQLCPFYWLFQFQLTHICTQHKR